MKTILSKATFILVIVAIHCVATTGDEIGSQPQLKWLPLNQPSDLKQCLSVAVHPFNDFAKHRSKWEEVFAAYHVQFLDRATGLNDVNYPAGVDKRTLEQTRGCQVRTGSYFTQSPGEFAANWGFKQLYYSKLHDDARWHDIRGVAGDDPYEIAAGRDLQGHILHTEGKVRTTMSLHCPDWVQYHKLSIEHVLEFGMDAIDIDSPQQVASYTGGPGDFSDWGIRAFQLHLRQAVTPEKAKSWGIADISKFDVKQYFLGLQRTGKASANALANPIIREWVLFNQLSEIDFHRQLKDHAAVCGAKLGKKFVPYYGNLHMGHPKNPLCIANPSVLLGQVVDVIQIESVPAVPPLRLTTLHKLGLAMGNYEKPVWSLHQPYYGFDYEPALPLTSSNQYERLLQIYMAETFAAGAVPEIDLGGWPGLGNPHTLSVTPRADIFPGLKSFLDFVVDHRQWFATQQPHNEVALVYSIPSFLWNDVPLWQKYPHDHQVAFMAFGRAMEEGHVPYDVVIFGHPRLWDDTRSMARLAAYRTIIFPRVDCVSKSQWQAVNRFVRAGGRLVVGGNLPETANRDENFNPRTGGNPQTLAKQPGQGAVATVPMDILQQFYKSAIENATYAPTLRQSILKPLGANSLLRTDAPAEVGINVFTAANIWILHLVNHQYQAGSDSIPPVDGFSISLRLPPTVTIRKASWFDASDNVAHDLDITHSGEYEVFRPPPLKVWDLIVLE